VAECLNQGQLNKLVRKWQKKLRLTDWEIVVSWCTEAQMAARMAEDGDEEHPEKKAKISVALTDTSDPWQSNTSALEHRKTRILIKKGCYSDAKEVESAIVHELLHTLIWPLAPDSADAMATVVLEQIINTLETVIMDGEN
jgi:hypothetical protein